MKKLLTTLVAWGPWGLFLAAVLDGAGIPVPSGVDVLIVYLASRSPNDVVLFALLAVLGSVTGNLFLFWIARRGGHAFLEKRTASKRSGRFRNWFHHYGLLTVFISALVPLPVMPMKIFVICAGALDTRPLRFVLVFVCARIPRYLALAFLGAAMGDNAVVYLRQHVWQLAAFAAGLFFVLWLLIRHVDRTHERIIAPE